VRAPAGRREGTGEPAGVRLLQLACATSAFDRFVVGALLVSIAGHFDVDLHAVAAVAGWYFLCYGLSQPLWGRCSDRLGCATTMRLALALAVAGSVASALAPTLPFLIGARAFTGTCIAAVVPAALVYIGDVVPVAGRQRTLTDLNAATAAGMTAATAVGGAVAALLSWQVAFLLPALPAAALVLALRHLPEPPAGEAPRGGFGTVLRDPRGRAVLLLGLLEGCVLLGLLAYFAPALESRGYSVSTAGALVGGYGVGLLLASRLVKRLAARTSSVTFLATGSLGLAVAYAAASASQSAWVIGSAALLVGGAWAGLHSTMQTWATEVVPRSRGAMMSLYAGALFVGGGAGTAAFASLAGRLLWQPLFLSGAALALLFGIAAVVAQRRYARAAAHLDADAAPPVL
jgi:predicted MFS family arabinose efflux permease